MARILAVADEVDEGLCAGDKLRRLRPDLVVSCGDLPFDYLEYLVTILSVPLLYVPGNHDPDIKGRPLDVDITGLFRTGAGRDWQAEPAGPAGCTSIDGRITDEAGLRVAGLGGSVRYSGGPNQYTQAEMRRRALRMELHAGFKRARDGRGVDILVAHSPPFGVGDDPEDPAHRGFKAFHRLVGRLSPRLLLHGHVHPFGRTAPPGRLGATEVHNVVGHKVLEV
jgi:3',5'-cyclic AMP phosphodiesterase CpdA